MGAGNDEVIWEAPGYGPFVELTRSKHRTAVSEYHSSKFSRTDEIIDQLNEILMKFLKQTVITLEGNAVMRRKFNGLICLSDPKFDLYMERPDPTVPKNISEDRKSGDICSTVVQIF